VGHRVGCVGSVMLAFVLLQVRWESMGRVFGTKHIIGAV